MSILKSHAKVGVWPWSRGAPQNFWVSATAEANDFRFCVMLGFANAHHKITRRRKIGRGPKLEELPNIWRFPFNIYAMADGSDFKFGIQLKFSEAHHKIAHRAKSVPGFGLGKLSKFGVF